MSDGQVHDGLGREPISVVKLAASLRAVGCVYAEEEAELALSTFTSADEIARVVAGRAAGFPLEHLLGWAEFGGRRYEVAAGAFVPRRRSLLLARLAVAALPSGPARLLDLCAGVGPIAGYVLGTRPDAVVTAADVSARAVEIAQRNLPGARVLLGDMYGPLSATDRFDVIVASPPYVPTDRVGLLPVEAREHEDPGALDGGPTGLEVAARIVAGAPLHLEPHGTLLVETSAEGAVSLVALMERFGFVARWHRSEQLSATVVSGRRHTAISHVRS